MPCGPATASSRWMAAANEFREIFGGSNTSDSIAFVFVRTGSKRLWWLPALANAMAAAPRSSAIHLVQKRPLNVDDASCVESLHAMSVIRIHDMQTDDAEAGPNGGRECSGYLFWLLRNWESLPSQMFFMHDAPPDTLTARSLLGALQSSRGFVNLLPPNAAVLRCFRPRRQEAEAASEHAPGGGGAIGVARTHYELPESLRDLLAGLRHPPPRCVLTPCCAEFRVRREAVHRHRTRADLKRVDAYVRGRDSKETSVPPHTGASMGSGVMAGWPPTRCHAMEHAWHLLFGEPSILAPLPPRTLRAAQVMRCCRPSSKGGGGQQDHPADMLLNGAGCSIRACPRLTHLPCNEQRVERGASRSSLLMTMYGVRALLRDDPSCALGGKESGATSWAPPHCGGVALLSGPQYVALAYAWNATRQRLEGGMIVASPRGTMGSGQVGAQLSCTLNL